MSIQKSRKKGVTVYSENPFWNKTEVKVGTKRISVAGGRHVSDDGESIQHGGVHVIHEVDRDEFVKLYTKNIKVFFDLKPSSMKVLQYLLAQLQNSINGDGIYLSWFSGEKYFSEQDLGVSRASFTRSMKELLEKKFIAESAEPNFYWINPNLFFNGDRMTFIKEYRVKNEQKMKEMSNEKQALPEPQRDPDTVDFIEGKSDAERV